MRAGGSTCACRAPCAARAARAPCTADAVKDERTGEWRFEYLVVDVGRDRIVVVQPRESRANIMRQPEKVYAVGD